MVPQAHRLVIPDLLAPLVSIGVSGGMVFTADGESGTTLATGDLREQALGLARRLRRRVSSGSCALIALPSGPDFFRSFFGCLYAGVIAIPVEPVRNAQAMERLEAIANESKSSVLLGTQSVSDRLAALDPAFCSRAGLDLMVVDTPDSSGGEDIPPEPPDPDSVAYLQFTSGSTGKPRGVMVSHNNVLHNLAIIDGTAGRPRAGSVVSWLPLYHDMGLVSALYALYTGLRLVLLSPMHFLQHPVRWLKAISQFRAVYSGAPNFAYELCSQMPPEADEAALDLSSWQFAFCGAEMVRPASLRRFARRFAPAGFRSSALSPAYGLAESTLIVSGVPAAREAEFRRCETTSLSKGQVRLSAEPSGEPSTEISECGSAAAGHHIRIVDPASCQALPDGHVGEIWVAGPSKALGYWQRPEESRATFEARLPDEDCSFLRTGDLGFLDGGRLFVTGRMKELVIVRGRNYHPREIESAAASAHPAVAAVVAYGDPSSGQESLVLMVEVRRGSWRHLSMNEVIRAIDGHLARRLGIRADFVGVIKPGSIPKTTSGKIQRLRFREQYRGGQVEYLATRQSEPPDPGSGIPSLHSDPAAVPNRVDIENWILQWVSYRLRVAVTEIDRLQPLNAYGLDSVAAVQLSKALEDWLEIPVPETLAWSYPSPVELSAYLEQATAKGLTSREPRSAALRSEVDVAIEWVERLTEPQVEHLYRCRINPE